MLEKLKTGNHAEKNHPTMVLMPSDKKMVEMLIKAGLIKQDSGYNIFYHTLIEETHDREISTGGLSLAWNQAGRETALGLTLEEQTKTFESLNSQFDEAIKALVQNKKAASEAIKIRNDNPYFKKVLI